MGRVRTNKGPGTPLAMSIPADLPCGKREHNHILCGFAKLRVPNDIEKCRVSGIGKKVAEGVALLQLH